MQNLLTFFIFTQYVSKYLLNKDTLSANVTHLIVLAQFKYGHTVCCICSKWFLRESEAPTTITPGEIDLIYFTLTGLIFDLP